MQFLRRSRVASCRMGLDSKTLMVAMFGWLWLRVLISASGFMSLACEVFISRDVGFMCVRSVVVMMLCVVLLRCRCRFSTLFCVKKFLWLLVVL